MTISLGLPVFIAVKLEHEAASELMLGGIDRSTVHSMLHCEKSALVSPCRQALQSLLRVQVKALLDADFSHVVCRLLCQI